MKFTLILLFNITFCSFIFGQDKPMPDRWREMVLDKTMPEQALVKFPNPKADKKDQTFRPLKYNEWFNVKNNKNFRVLHYENIEGFKDVKLFFLDNKLVVIQLEPEKLAASLLPQTYEVDFEVLVSGFDKAANSKDFERDKGKIYPKSFPSMYDVMHKADKSYIFAAIENNSFGSILGKSMGLEDDSNSMPGKVYNLQLISRSLENKAATNLLK